MRNRDPETHPPWTDRPGFPEATVTDDGSGGAADGSGDATDDGAGDATDDGSVERLVADVVAASAAALVGWSAVLVVAEALGARPWRWFGGASEGALVGLAVVGVPTLLARRRYGALLPERWLHAGVAFVAGALVATLSLLGWVLAALFSDAVPLPRWVLSGPAGLVVLAAGGAVGVGVYAAAVREWGR